MSAIQILPYLIQILHYDTPTYPDPPLYPLAHFAIAQTTEIEQAEDLLSAMLGGRVHVGRADDDACRFRLRMNGVKLGRIVLGVNGYDTDTSVGPGVFEDSVIFAIAHSGCCVVHLDDAVIAVTGQTGALISPGQKILAEHPQNSSIIILRTSQTLLAARFQELTGREPKGLLAFERSVDLSCGYGAVALSAVKFAIQELHAILPVWTGVCFAWGSRICYWPHCWVCPAAITESLNTTGAAL